MNRGNERRSIFIDDDDRKKYLALLARQVEKGRIEVQAYCLMDNQKDQGDWPCGPFA